jgi:hypothetical protein
MEPPPLPPLPCQLCGKVAEPGHAAQLCSDCRTTLSKRPFPLWIKLVIILVGLVFLYALAKAPASFVASIAFERGQRAEAAGNFGTAATEYAKAVEQFPESTSAVARLGIMQYRTSTARYQSKPDNLKTVAQELGVSTVLEGAVQKAGDKVRVDAYTSWPTGEP